jgi:hypothetical protein
MGMRRRFFKQRAPIERWIFGGASPRICPRSANPPVFQTSANFRASLRQECRTNNAQNLIESDAAAASEGLSFGEDVFERLLDAGAYRVDAFRIMEAVRKGKARCCRKLMQPVAICPAGFTIQLG